MMKKMWIWILIIIVALVMFVAWCVAYTLLSNRIDNANRQGFINEAKAFLMSDNHFVSEYGTIISMESEDRMPIKNKDSDLKEYYMDFLCVTNKGEFNIRIYHTWNDGWSFKYGELPFD